jgi:hypothetical protein
MVAGCTQHALAVLRTLNSLEKFAAIGWPITPKVADLVAVISDVATMARPHLTPGVELRSHVTLEHVNGGDPADGVHELGGPLQLWMDDLVVREVLLNLVQNSVRFTACGFIELRCTVSLDAGCSPPLSASSSMASKRWALCRFNVRDTGTGIRGAAMENLFQKYATTGGIGVGVHLSKQQVESMGSKLVVASPWSSDQQPGTDFSFTLELELAQPHPPPFPASGGLINAPTPPSVVSPTAGEAAYAVAAAAAAAAPAAPAAGTAATPTSAATHATSAAVSRLLQHPQLRVLIADDGIALCERLDTPRFSPHPPSVTLSHLCHLSCVCLLSEYEPQDPQKRPGARLQELACLSD